MIKWRMKVNNNGRVIRKMMKVIATAVRTVTTRTTTRVSTIEAWKKRVSLVPCHNPNLNLIMHPKRISRKEKI